MMLKDVKSRILTWKALLGKMGGVADIAPEH